MKNLNLTDEEIKEYRRGGHVVEELPKAQGGGKIIKPIVNTFLKKYNINPSGFTNKLDTRIANQLINDASHFGLTAVPTSKGTYYLSQDGSKPYNLAELYNDWTVKGSTKNLTELESAYLENMGKKYNTRQMIEKYYKDAPVTSIHGSELRLQDYPQEISEKLTGVQGLWKPEGLWYGKGNSWRDWAQYEMPEKFHGSNAFSLDLNYGHGPDQVVKLTSPESVAAFTDAFGKSLMPDLPRPLLSGIDWPAVANRFGGVEISPYRKPETFNWSDTWDVDSGAIWNKRAIKGHQRIPGIDQSRPEWDFQKGGDALSNKISKLHREGYTADGQAYAIAKNMGYAQGGELPKAAEGLPCPPFCPSTIKNIFKSPIKPPSIPYTNFGTNILPPSISYKPFTSSYDPSTIDWSTASDYVPPMPLIDKVQREGINHTLRLSDEIRKLQSTLPSIKLNNEYDLGQFKKKYLQNKGLKQEDFKLLDDYVLGNKLSGEIQPIDLANSLHNELTFPVTVQKLYTDKLRRPNYPTLYEQGEIPIPPTNELFQPYTQYLEGYTPKEYRDSPNYEYAIYTINTPGIRVRGNKHWSDEKNIGKHVGAGQTTIGHMRGFRGVNDPTHFTVVESQSDVMQAGRKGDNIKEVLVQNESWDTFNGKGDVSFDFQIPEGVSFFKEGDTWFRKEFQKSPQPISTYVAREAYHTADKAGTINARTTSAKNSNENKFLKLLQGNKGTKSKDRRYHDLNTNAFVQQLVNEGYTTIDFPLGRLAVKAQGEGSPKYVSPEDIKLYKQNEKKYKVEINKLKEEIDKGLTKKKSQYY